MGQDRAIARWVLIGLVAAAAASLFLLPTADDSGQLTGIVLGVDGDLTEVRSFEVLSDGDRWIFAPSPDGDYEFPLGHLRDHLRTGDPVYVEFERVDGVLVAMRVSDAD
jgi:hypothetical protein